MLAILSSRSRYLMVVLYIPENPIGYVKSAEELESQILLSFYILELVILKQSRFVVIFAKTLHNL